MGSNAHMLRRFLTISALLAGFSFPAAYAQLAIEGVDSNIESRLRAQLTQMESNCSATEARARGIARQSVNEAREILRALGYYQPEISQSTSVDDQGCRQVELNVSTGPATQIIDVEIVLQGAAQDDENFAELANNPPLTVGDQLNHGRYESYKSEFGRLAVRRGYYDAGFTTSEIRVDPDSSEASILLHYDSGERYRYGEIDIDEVGPSLDFVERYLPFEHGAPVNSAELIEFQQRLIDSQYFSAVSVRPQIAQRENGQVTIRVALQPVKTWHYSVGVGIDTNSGPRASVGVENRLLNSGGDTASANLSLSPRLRQFELAHRHPLEDPTREIRQWTFGVRQDETDTSTSSRQSVGWSRIKALDGGWARTLGVSYRSENSEIGTLDIKSQLFLPSVAFQKSSSRGERRVSQGWRMNLDLSGAVNNVLSDTSLVQGHLESKGILGLGTGRLIGRVELGTTWVERFAEVPASIRYFAGGDNSVRGYDYESLGPKDAEGNVVGGRHLVVGSLEYDMPISENWDAAVFVDTGDAFNNQPNFKSGAGFGVRWHSVVGTIRLDIAFPSDGSGLRLHIFMGPEL